MILTATSGTGCFSKPHFFIIREMMKKFNFSHGITPIDLAKHVFSKYNETRQRDGWTNLEKMKNYKMKCERYLNESAFRTFFCFKQ